MNIGFCIGSSPGELKTKFALDLAKECKSLNYVVDVFLFDDGIYNALQNKSVKCVTNVLMDLVDNNDNVNVCVNMAKYRGVNESNTAEYVDISSLISFSGLINNSNVVVTTK